MHCFHWPSSLFVAASRAKLSAVKSISKMRGQSNAMLYPQPEGNLGDCMVKHGRDLGDESTFGAALVEAGETYKQLADIKYALEDNVKQNFIEPLQHIQTKDLKEVNVSNDAPSSKPRFPPTGYLVK